MEETEMPPVQTANPVTHNSNTTYRNESIQRLISRALFTPAPAHRLHSHDFLVHSDGRDRPTVSVEDGPSLEAHQVPGHDTHIPGSRVQCLIVKLQTTHPTLQGRGTKSGHITIRINSLTRGRWDSNC